MKRILVFCLLFAVGPVVFAGDIAKVRERLKNDPYMAPFYTGKILPFPQKVSYGTEFYPLENVGVLLGKGIEKTDPRLKLLIDRIERYGGKTAFVDAAAGGDFKTVIIAGDAELKVPAESEGYAIRCYRRDGKNMVSFAGRDQLGFLWAVNSLIQLVTLRGDAPVIRSADVDDWPYVSNRGAFSLPALPGIGVPGTAEYLPVLTKLSFLGFHTYALIVDYNRYSDAWKRPPTPERTREVTAAGRHLSSLGVHWAQILVPNTTKGVPEDQIRAKNDADFNVVWSVLSMCLDAGGDVFLNFDDNRYPLHPDDVKEFGKAWAADAYFVDRLYAAVKAKCPAATFYFCQPFYASPREGGARPESGFEYLREIQKRLPKEIRMAWCGPACHSAAISSKDVDDFVALIGRPPAFWQNATDNDEHIYGYPRISEPLSWWLNNGRTKELYKRFTISGYNCQSVYAAMLWSAMLWNPDAYDAAAAAKDATEKLLGPAAYPVAREFVASLDYFDQFDRLRPTPYAAKNLAEIERRLAIAKALYDKMVSEYPAAAKLWDYHYSGKMMDLIDTFVKRVKNDKTLLAGLDPAVALEELARKEMKFAKGADQLFTAYSLTGGVGPQKVMGRPAKWIYGKKSATRALSFNFNVDPFPPESEYVLTLNGRAGGKGEKGEIAIAVGGQTIFKGANPFSSTWETRSFPIPILSLQRQSPVTIENLDDNEKGPYVMVSYAFVRKINKDKGKQP